MQRTRADLERAAAQAGGVRLVDSAIVQLADGTFTTSGRFQFSDPWAAARLLQVLADEDAADPDADVAAWARAILEQCDGDPDLFARALHANVQQAIEFEEEDGERFQSPRATMMRGKGDCDCQARLVYVMAASQGLGARLRYFEQEGEPTHVVAALETSHGMQWAETTIPAEFGENPQAAYKRLGLDQAGVRQDLAAIGSTGWEHDDVVKAQADLDALFLSTELAIEACKNLTAVQQARWHATAVDVQGYLSMDPDLLVGGGAQAEALAQALTQELLAWGQELRLAGCQQPIAAPPPSSAAPPGDVKPWWEQIARPLEIVAIAGAVGAVAAAAWKIAGPLVERKARAA